MFSTEHFGLRLQAYLWSLEVPKVEWEAEPSAFSFGSSSRHSLCLVGFGILSQSYAEKTTLYVCFYFNFLLLGKGLKSLLRLQNAAVRALTRSSRGDHISPVRQLALKSRMESCLSSNLMLQIIKLHCRLRPHSSIFSHESSQLSDCNIICDSLGFQE